MWQDNRLITDPRLLPNFPFCTENLDGYTLPYFIPIYGFGGSEKPIKDYLSRAHNCLHLGYQYFWGLQASFFKIRKYFLIPFSICHQIIKTISLVFMILKQIDQSALNRMSLLAASIKNQGLPPKQDLDYLVQLLISS